MKTLIPDLARGKVPAVAPVLAPTRGLYRLLARLAGGAVPVSGLDDADREALSLAMRRREVLLSAAGGIAYVVRRARA